MPENPLAHYAEPEATPRKMQILIIDDNEIDRQRILRLCERAGLRFDAVEAGSIDEMQQALDAHSFDLIFVDYLLAGETGLDAVDKLAAHSGQHTAAAIMVAGEGQIDVAVEAMRRGCSDYLTKATMNVDTLQKSIATALERRMLFSAIDDERAARAQLERSIREYANACTSDMRAILSATLRRVRQLRTHTASDTGKFSTDLSTLESDIDRLWEALPSFREVAIPASNLARLPVPVAVPVAVPAD